MLEPQPSYWYSKGERLLCSPPQRDFPMTTTLHAIFENGVFRPVEPVALPESTAVELEVRVPEVQGHPSSMTPGLAKVYSILGERYNSGHTDAAERHNEHQP
jgi:predicted DNA-binding antitoxin AbrB/MazE fold protein